MIGKTISHYKVLEQLGGGGMGVVYKAQDTRLDRFIALKFLPPELSRDEEANKRFIQEAKSASALDHPNICTIHDIGETEDGQLFIAMANYDGQTLKQRIAQGPLPIAEALEVVIQMTEGLIKAHGAEIIHRDIKPANIMITADGLIKILDFGLAKLEGEPRLTTFGTTLGTVAYTSPEQARGEEADARSDTWSVGVTLYEMVSGQVPFQGEQAAVMHAIQTTEPQPLTALRSGVPLELERIVGRALSKRPEDRYQTVSDLRSELLRIQRTLDTSDDTPTATMVSAGRPNSQPATRRKWWPAAAALAAILIGTLGYMYLAGPAPALTPRLTNALQVTSDVGIEDHPSWSPDGRMLAYHSSKGGNSDIWVTQIGTGLPVNRTEDYTGDDLRPAWSPDGNQIAFLSDRDGGGIFVMSAVGGVPRKITSKRVQSAFDRESPFQWSPDGMELASVDRDSPDSPDTDRYQQIVSLNTGNSRRILLTDRIFDLSWSPDGRYFAYVAAVSPIAEVTQLWILRIEDQATFPLTDGLTTEWSATWSSNNEAVYAISNRGGSMDLWRYPFDNDLLPGTPTPITTGIGMRTAVFSQDEKKIAYSKGRRQVSYLWRVPILPDRAATWDEATQLSFNEAWIEFSDVSPDGTQLLFSSDRLGNQDLWMMPTGGGEARQLTTDPAPDWSPRMSPDGSQIAFLQLPVWK